MNKKQLRRDFVEKCLERDHDKCRVCGEPQGITVHHVTDRNEMPEGGYSPLNGITLCVDCHWKAEVWHMSGNKEAHPGFHPDELYAMIGSDYEKAFYASEALG